MKVQDLHILPKFSDGWSYLYVEHCRIDKEDHAIAIHDANGKVPIPCANLAMLMLGPGVSITHAAISVLAEHGCLVVWCGYDVADIYKTELTIPTAFRITAEGENDLERRVRLACRDMFVAIRLLKRIIPDIQTALMLHGRGTSDKTELFDQDAAAPGSLWDLEKGKVEGGYIHPIEANEEETNRGSSDS